MNGRQVPRAQVVRWSPPNLFGQLGSAEVVWMGGTSWTVEGPLAEIGAYLDDARRWGTVRAKDPVPTPNGLLVTFTVTPRPQARQPTWHEPMYSPTAARPGAMAARPVPAPEPAPRAAVATRWVWVAGVAGLALVGTCAVAAWAIESTLTFVAAHAKEIVGAVLAAIFGAALLARLVRGGGRSGTWKTD